MTLSRLSFRRCKPLATLRNLSAALCLGIAPAYADPATIVALGDSLTQGYGLPVDQGFVPVLQQWLEDQGADVTLINAGVSGDTTAGGLARTEWSLVPETSALIVNLGGNDLLRGIDPATSRANLDAILQKADARNIPVLLLGLRAPGNYGASFQQAFDAMYSDLAEKHGALFVPDYLGPVTAGERLNPRYIQNDGIHPNAEGVELLVAAVGPAVLDLVARTN